MNKVLYLISGVYFLFIFQLKGQHNNSHQIDSHFSFGVGGYDRPTKSRFMSQRDTSNVYDIRFSMGTYYARKIGGNKLEWHLISGFKINYGYLGVFAESYLEELGIDSFQDHYVGEINPSYLDLCLPIGFRAIIFKFYIQLEALNNIHLWKPKTFIFDESHMPIRNREVRSVIEEHYATYFRRFYNSLSLQLGYKPDLDNPNVILGYHMDITITNRFRDLEHDKFGLAFGVYLNYTFNQNL